MSDRQDGAARRGVGVRDIPLVLLSPRRVLARVEDVAAWGWPLVILLTAVTLIGYATVQSGLIDQEIELGVRQRIAQIESTQRDVVERSALRDLYEQEYKKGEFEKLLTRIRVVAAEPVRILSTVLLVAAVLYGVVALGGRKPEWHTLLTICVLAGFTDVLRQLVLLGLRLRYRTLDVDTSLALLVPLWAAKGGGSATASAVYAGLLSALEPFRIWFWWIVVVGLSATAQLPGWRAWLICGLCWLTAAGVRCGLGVAAVQLGAISGPASP